MHLTPYILDRPTRICNGSIHEVPLLALPYGLGCLLDHLVRQLESLDCGRPAVLSMVDRATEGVSELRRAATASVDFLDQAEFERRVKASESSDFLLLIDPSHWPTRGHRFRRFIEKASGFRGASHVVAIGRDPEQLVEQVEYDAAGRVSKVGRVYRRMTWPEVPSAPVLVSVLPARLLADAVFTDLADLRVMLASKGVLTQDLPLQADTVDLSVESGWLTLGERSLQARDRTKLLTTRSRSSEGILMGRDCRVHPSARLRAPIVIQDRAVIEANATVIGPTIVGACSHVGQGAVVAQAVLASGASIESGGRVSHCVVPGDGQAPDRAPGGFEAEAGTVTRTRTRTVRRGTRTSSWVAPLGKQFQWAVKNVVDVIGAAAGLILTSPIFLAAAILIKLTSRGPVFFVHRREGMGGREFPCLKFRTMLAGAHQQQREMYEGNDLDGPQFKQANDPRVTRVGAWLRRTNIDEMPQLLNVLAGQMSLVGPRPSPFRENQICVAWRRARLSVRPGITGLWQICRDRSQEGDFHQWIFYDLAYVRNFSLGLDLRILYQTVVTLGGRKRVALSRLVKHPHPSRVEEHTVAH